VRSFCYYHHTTRRPANDPKTRKARRSTLTLREDRASIQPSIGLILQGIATNQLDPAAPAPEPDRQPHTSSGIVIPPSCFAPQSYLPISRRAIS
jgi:hypothetical protein